MRIAISLLFCCLCVCHSFSQCMPVSPDTILHRLWHQTRIFPQEKLYLSTDKPAYVCKENIWFRAFVVNSISHRPEPTSRYVYVELINPFDSIVCRIKARQDERQFIHGHIALEDTLPAGNYNLRAYTRYMENDGDSCFFHKSIPVMSPLEKSVAISGRFNDKSAILRFYNPMTQAGINIENIVVSTESKRLGYDKDSCTIRFRLERSALKHKVILVKAGNYSRFIPIDTASSPDFHVDFLPEGGQLVQGAFCKVGFKALNADGMGEDITGTVLDDENHVITRIESFHRGMGCFSFVPQKGRTYFAECENGEHTKKRFQLPEVQKGGYALQINQDDTAVDVSVLGLNMLSADSLILLVHQRGYPQYVKRWDNKCPVLSFHNADFFTGIAHFVLLDNYGRIRSERMAFMNNSDIGRSEIRPDKSTYESREKVSLDITLTDQDGNPLDGNCSVAVTDDRDVKPDSCITLLSTLLLSSDLKGYIEDPNWYFRSKNRKKAETALDMLLLTQGWRRYSLESVIGGDYRFPKIPSETSMEIRGNVTTTITRKPVREASIRIVAPGKGMLEEVRTDKVGAFRFGGFEFPDSTGYVVTAYSAKKKENVVLQVEKERFPLVGYTLVPQRARYKKHFETPEARVELLAKVGTRMSYEYGSRQVFLDDVTITARKKMEYKTEYQIAADKTITEEQIEESLQPNIASLVASRAGLWSNGSSLSFRGGQAQIIMDGVCQEGKSVSFILHDLSLGSVEQIDIIKGQVKCAGYVASLSSGVPEAIVAITTKRGRVIPVTSSVNMAKVELLGYQEPMEFYSPKYETSSEKAISKPDLRTTIYWKPDMIIKDGKAALSFYTADTETSYSIVLEGVSSRGVLFRKVRPLKIGTFTEYTFLDNCF